MGATIKRLLFKSGWISCFLVVELVSLLGPTGFGFFLSVFGAQYWSVILVNLGFILIAREGFATGGARWKRIAPAVWFGGYLVIAAISHMLAASFYSGIDRNNAAQKIAWNRATDTLAMAHSWSDENRAAEFSGEDLVRNYGVDRAWSGYFDEFKDGLQWRSEVSLHRGTCPAGTMHDGPDGIKASRYGPKSTEFADDLCIVHRDVQPEGRVVSIVDTGLKQTDLILDREIQRIEVTGADGMRYHLQSGMTRPIEWYPAPVIGCDWGVHNPSPRWCGVRFDREFGRDKARFPEQVITAALGLTKVSLESRFPALRWHGP